MPIYIEVPCKPLVKRYIHNRYGCPVQFPQNDFLYTLLQNLMVRHETRNDAAINIQYYTCTVDLPITFRDYDNYGNELTLTAIRHINQTIQDIIEEHLYLFISFYHRIAGMQIKDAIATFRQIYNIEEEDYKTDAIIKFYQRERKRREERKITPTFVLSPKAAEKISMPNHRTRTA